MRTLEILDGGLFTTVQDLGRVGYQRFGVAVSGAMDPFALRAANVLVGNGDRAAGLEMTMMGPEIRFPEAAVIALTGADLGPMINRRPAVMWRRIRVSAGAVLSYSGLRDGLRAYLAVAGGVDVAVVLGSRSTSTRAALGGFQGRALKTGDVLAIGDAAIVPGSPGSSLAGEKGSRSVFGGHVPFPAYGHDHLVRVVPGPQDDAFTAAGLATFTSAVYTMTPQSDRIGCRFQGPPLAHRVTADIVSDGTVMGSVQVSGDGLPIVLMADRGTTGGYTKIATVISADISKLAQAAPGDRVRFTAVTLDEAHALLREQEAVLEGIRKAGLPAPSEAEGEPGDPGTSAEPNDSIFDEDAGAELAAPAWDDLADALFRTRRRPTDDDRR